MATRRSFLKHLPRSTCEYRFEGIERMKQQIEHEIRAFDENAERSQYIIFSQVPFNTIFSWPDSESFSKLFDSYSEELGLLVVKMISAPHEVASQEFHWLLGDKLQEMRIRRCIISIGRTTASGRTRAKQPDSSYRPRKLPLNRTDNWPSVTIETGVSESRLDSDCQWWLHESAGEVIISRAQGTTRVDGAPLIITFENLFLRAKSGDEGDIIFTTEDLQGLAEKVWDIQHFEGIEDF
ncbi:hypothetical protein PRK78_004173 [Emydomyces testavorans]|uniref:Uncharacterized protein n=1 Tax=Emydomyces testavorans TaxID=2070801 RepID=A0AAF0IID5_9EURO|nr:hypothetical protein PRK78_004173 [Emydomyces testavorans]